MKKLLSLVFAVIMVLSIMPVAYAERVTYSPEIEQYIEDYIKGWAYARNIYETPEQRFEADNIIDENTDIFPSYKNLINIEADGRLEELTAFHESLKKGIDEVERKISDGELVIVVDVYEYSKCFVFMEGHCYYSDEALKGLADRDFNGDKYINAATEAEIAIEQIEKMFSEYTGTQAEFDAAVEKLKYYVNLLCDCLDGNHPYGEYISDNNATEEADGTKTATCDFCGASDTITDEGTKLPEKEATFFEKLFDLIKDFLDIIFSIFE